MSHYECTENIFIFQVYASIDFSTAIWRQCPLIFNNTTIIIIRRRREPTYSKHGSITHLRAAADASAYIPVWVPSRPCQCSYWLSWPPSRPPVPPPPVCPSSCVSGRCWESGAAAASSFLLLLLRSGWALCPRLHGGAPRRPRRAKGRWMMSSRCSPQSPRRAAWSPGRTTASSSSRDPEAGDRTPSWRWKWIHWGPQTSGDADCNTAPWCGQALTADIWS